MRFAITHLKRNLHHRIQTIDSLRREIDAGIEPQTVKPGPKGLSFESN